MLTTQQLIDIEQLQKECETHDHLQLKLNWEMLRKPESDQLDFFHYENGQLVAFLGLYAFGSTVEVCGMVKPSERRKGHFHRLFQQGMQKVKQNGYKKILLNAPAGSDAAKVFLNKQGAEYAFSEHQMEWQEKPLEETDGIILRQATLEDYEMRVRLSVTAFGVDEEDARAMESQVLDNTAMLMIDGRENSGESRRGPSVDLWIFNIARTPGKRNRQKSVAPSH